MAFRVRLLPRASHDLETIYRQVIQESPIQGSDWYNGLQRSIYSLKDLPERCPVASKLSTDIDIVRRLLYGTYPHVYNVYYHGDRTSTRRKRPPPHRRNHAASFHRIK